MSKPVPKLRFKEFEANSSYQKRKFKDIFLFSIGKNIKQNEASPEFETPCVRYGELYHMYGEVITKVFNKTNLDRSELTFSDGDEILLPSAGEDPLDIGSASALTLENVAIGRTINILKPIKANTYSHVYVSYYINQKLKRTISTLAKGVSISNVYNSDLRRLEILLPNLPEQTKIASFLSSVDTKIQQLTNKKELLAQYKKGVMQKIFNQEIRFKDEKGKSYPNWEEVKLGAIFRRITAKNKERNTNVLTISAQFGLVNQESYFNRSVSSEDTSGYYLLQKNDFAYNKSYSKGYPLGAIKRLNQYEKGIVSTLYICFRIKGDNSANFFEQYFEGGNLNHGLSKIAQEGARNHGLLNLSVVDFFETIRIRRPSSQEQRKVAAFLRAIDAKIDLAVKDLEGVKQFKKGLLQQMFV